MMERKLFLSGIAAVISIIAATAFAIPNWDITGTWDMEFYFGPGTYPHTMNVTIEDTATGEFSGTGFYNPNPGYTWDVTGTVDGDSIEYHMVYTGLSPGYTVDGVGTIAADGLSMSGTCVASNGPCTWAATGTAAELDSDEDGISNREDMCQGTIADSPDKALGTNRWIWNGDSWETASPKSPKFVPDMEYTYGCSCEQILGTLEDKTDLSFDGHYMHGCSKSILEDWHNGEYYLETVAVPADSASDTLSATELKSGEEYRLKAYGTAYATGDNSIVFDAEYSSTGGGSWMDGVSGYEAYGPNLLDLMVNGGFIDWGTYSDDHIYWHELPGTGDLLTLRIYDIYYPNNSGNLLVDIIVKLW